MSDIVKKESITNYKTLKTLDNDDHMNELLNVIKLIYADTMRTTEALNAELDIYNDMIERAKDPALIDKYRLEQARAAQKSSVDAKLVNQLVCALDRMREITNDENVKNKSAEIVFLDDTDKDS